MMMKAEIRVMLSQVKEFQRFVTNHLKLRRGKEGFPCRFSESMDLPTPSFQTCGLGNCGRINSCFIKPPTCGQLLQHPRKVGYYRKKFKTEMMVKKYHNINVTCHNIHNGSSTQQKD